MVIHKLQYFSSLNDLVKANIGVSFLQGKLGLPDFVPKVVCLFFSSSLFNLIAELLG